MRQLKENIYFMNLEIPLLQFREEMKMEKYYLQNENVITFPIDTGESLHNLDNDNYYSIDSGISTMIWDNLDGSNSVENLKKELSEAFDIDYETISHDVDEFIEKLLNFGLITLLENKLN